MNNHCNQQEIQKKLHFSIKDWYLSSPYQILHEKKVTKNRISVFGIGLHDMKSTMELKGKKMLRKVKKQIKLQGQQRTSKGGSMKNEENYSKTQLKMWEFKTEFHK